MLLQSPSAWCYVIMELGRPPNCHVIMDLGRRCWCHCCPKIITAQQSSILRYFIMSNMTHCDSTLEQDMISKYMPNISMWTYAFILWSVIATALVIIGKILPEAKPHGQVEPFSVRTDIPWDRGDGIICDQMDLGCVRQYVGMSFSM